MGVTGLHGGEVDFYLFGRCVSREGEQEGTGCATRENT